MVEAKRIADSSRDVKQSYGLEEIGNLGAGEVFAICDARITMSTRRFCARPWTVRLLAMG